MVPVRAGVLGGRPCVSLCRKLKRQGTLLKRRRRLAGRDGWHQKKSIAKRLLGNKEVQTGKIEIREKEKKYWKGDLIEDVLYQNSA